MYEMPVQRFPRDGRRKNGSLGNLAKDAEVVIIAIAGRTKKATKENRQGKAGEKVSQVLLFSC